MKKLINKLDSDKIKVGIIGQGYVGLPLSIAFAKKYRVIGYDINSEAIERLKSGKSHILDVSDNILKKHLGQSYFPSNDFNDLADCDVIIICVPTPLSDDKIPDLSYIKNACESISEILHKGQFIVLESTTYPGTTEEFVVPILEKAGLKAGIDFGVAYSPERVDPGNKQYPIEKVTKVVGGINKECTEFSYLLYGNVISEVFKVDDMKTAESVKMLENIFRGVNIALINEMSLIFEKMNIDTWEVVNAAATKPYGFMPFYPGPGIGGHCIPLDPYYMSYKAKKYGLIPRFIETSGEINTYMETHVINLAERGLATVGKKLFGSKVVIFGLSYKKNVDDVRESPSIKIIEELSRMGVDISVYDPYVKSIRTKYGVYSSLDNLESAFFDKDCAIFLIAHDQFSGLDVDTITKEMSSPIVIDCKNIILSSKNIIYLGVGKKFLKYGNEL